MGGPIEDKHKGKKDRRKNQEDPLTGGLGDRDKNTNKVDYDEETIRDQKNKK
ncbi:hypothetical protein MKO06_15830 [Gramella sp. GC03-9]|uniref:Uncharacterized protein n=1 Tax=Christiangramia oceanisediminis TaxID=2920386 RepID=A0A9X2KZT4_9FLAO|nr:hypothetical protein [Gramella oceanisediminis]MCP9201380.1 hypothetical protein [Gramella oceanisediminis]